MSAFRSGPRLGALMPVEPKPWPTEASPRRRSRRDTRLLVTVVGLLAGIAGAEAWYLRGDDAPAVSKTRPVVVGQARAASAVAVAATSAEALMEWSHETYDQDIESDATRVTGDFAAQFRATRAAARERVMRQRRAATAEVAMQGVVRASPERVVALVYLDQTRTADGTEAVTSQHTIQVTVLRTGSGWLVSQLETR